MKKSILIILVLLSVGSLSAQKDLASGSFVHIDIENHSNFARKNAPVVLSVDTLVSKFKHYNNQRIAIFFGKKEIPSQCDDLNKDGRYDEISFLIDLKANEKIRLYARMMPSKAKEPVFEKGVYAQMIRKVKDSEGKPQLKMVNEVVETKDDVDMYHQMYHHGVAFESDLIAYRIYFNGKQTTDVYGKVTPKLELAETKWYPTEAQDKRGYGDDILRTGNSVGVGTFKGWNGVEALHFDTVEKRTQRILATGALRNVVEVDVEKWKYFGKEIDVKIRYTQYAHHRDVQVDVIFPNPLDSLVFCTGVQKIKEINQMSRPENSTVGSWGRWWPIDDKDTVNVRQTKQTFGLGVCVENKYVKDIATDKLNYLILLKTNGDPFIRYHFTAVACKEKNGYKTPDAFFEYLKHWDLEIQQPIVISLSTK